MPVLAQLLARTLRTARLPTFRLTQAPAAKAPVTTALKVAGGVVSVLGVGLYARAAPPSAFPFSLWARQVSAAEVQAHSSADSCWVIIDDAVYDATSWLAHHPVGAQAILDHAGKDISELFENAHAPGIRAVVQITGMLKPIGVAEPSGQTIAGQ